jgi:tetratricopeptide (TPR) repeat protein
LLRYYAQKGKAEEKKGNWAKAEEAYAMAAELSQQPKALIAYKKNMNLKVRQLRFDSIYQQRKKEDEAWIAWQDSGYIPPKGLSGDDAVFANAREDMDQEVDDRIATTWKRAQRYRDNDMPEMAWLYADSYLRLYPGDKKAQDLKNAMATALPKGFILPKDEASVAEGKRTKAVKTEVTPALVKGLMKQGKWIQAKKEALNLRKSGDESADKLLAEIDAKISSLAEDAYQKGNIAFRSENIDAAVKFWQQAVDLKPNEQTYVDSLRRGKQIQERLQALKKEAEK